MSCPSDSERGRRTIRFGPRGAKAPACLGLIENVPQRLKPIFFSSLAPYRRLEMRHSI